jgi:hypothetical protein
MHRGRGGVGTQHKTGGLKGKALGMEVSAYTQQQRARGRSISTGVWWGMAAKPPQWDVLTTAHVDL